MKKIKYQLVKVNQPISSDPFRREIQVQLDPSFDICTGIMLVEHPLFYTGGGDFYDINPPAYADNIKIGVDNSSGTIYSPVPVKLLSLSLEESKELMRDSFKPLFTKAAGENINIIIAGDQAEAIYDFDIYLRLERSSELKQNNVDYQHIRFTAVAGNSLFETSEYILNSRFKKVKGIWMNSDYDFQARIGIKTTSGEYQLETLIHKMLRKSVNVPYADRFFPLDFKASGNVIKFEVEMIQAIVSNIDVDIVFELEK